MTGRASPTKAWAAFVLAWLGISCALVVYLESGESRTLIPVLAAFVAVFALWHPIPRAGLAAAILASATSIGALYLAGATIGLAPVALATVVAFGGTGMLADRLAGHAEAEARQRRHDTLLIDELTPTAAGGTMKWQHARKQLEDEIGRARRYKYPVSLVLIGLDPLLQAGDGAARQAALQHRSDLIKLLISKTRTSDRVSLRDDDQLALVLTHTPLRGAQAFLDKNLPEIKVATGLDPRIGVVEFPADAGSVEELVSEAEATLEFSGSSGIRVVSRSLLVGVQEEGPASGAAAR